MTVPSRSKKTIESSIIKDISNNRPDLDLVSGPLADVVVTPQANLIKVVEDKIEHASQLTSLKYYQNFSSTELDDFASTYGITRLQGTKSKTILAFVMTTEPIADIEIPLGTSVQIPKAIMEDNQNYQFVTTERIYYRAFDSDRFATTSGSNRKWIFYAPAECINVGNYANGIQPKRLTETSTSAAKFTQVYNINTTKGGTDIEDDDHFSRRIFAVMGYGSVLHPAGLKKYIYDEFKDDVLDISVQKGKKVLRVPDTKQAVDIYIIGSKQKNYEEIFTYDGSRRLVLQKQPLIEITLATASNQSFDNDVDFHLSKDVPTTFNPGINNFTQEGAVAGSVKSTDSLVWNFTTSSNLPTVGDSVTAYYIYNKLISDIQTRLDNTLDFIAADVLVREGQQIPIYMGFTVTLKSTAYSASDVYDNISNSIMSYINKNVFGDNSTAISSDSMIDDVLKNVAGIDTIKLDYFNREKHLSINVEDNISLNLKRTNKHVELKWVYGLKNAFISSSDSVGIYRSLDNGLTYSLIDTINANQTSYYDEPNATNIVYKIKVTTPTKTFMSNDVNTYTRKEQRIESIILSDIQYAYTDKNYIYVRFI